MRKRPYCLLTGLIVAGGLICASLYEYDTHVVRGWVRGEAFYLARPTSYWKGIIRDDMKRSQREMRPDYRADEIGEGGGIVRWACCELGIDTKRITSEVLARDPLARPVLEELSRDGSPRIRGFARYLLGPDRGYSRFLRDPDPKMLEDWFPPALSLVLYSPWDRALAMSSDLPDD